MYGGGVCDAFAADLKCGCIAGCITYVGNINEIFIWGDIIECIFPCGI